MPNQNIDLSAQLALGIRTLELDIHYISQLSPSGTNRSVIYKYICIENIEYLYSLYLLSYWFSFGWRWKSSPFYPSSVLYRGPIIIRLL